MRKLQGAAKLRLILCLIDVVSLVILPLSLTLQDDPLQTIRELTRLTFINHFTLIIAKSTIEAAKYLESFKSLEHKPPDVIMERIDADPLSKFTDAITSIKSVNKTDVVTLASNFGVRHE